MEQLVKALSHHLDLATEDIKPDTNLRELVADSLDFIELILDLEDRFNVEISDDDLNQLITVEDLNTLINKISGQCGAV